MIAINTSLREEIPYVDVLCFVWSQLQIFFGKLLLPFNSVSRPITENTNNVGCFVHLQRRI